MNGSVGEGSCLKSLVTFMKAEGQNDSQWSSDLHVGATV